ncbi:DUF317 domain-containing protein [Streptomyces hebeiensis]|uniref:DUF317 domain-containing protein n=1 Tax=Streptomyces hebeiensis TaxID=229486 RepID=A0ABN1UNA4_9ACTN
MEQAEQHYLVAPRHLAGGGDLRYVTDALRACGWKDLARSGGPLVFDSPDRTVRIGYDPFVQPGGWTIRGKATRQHSAWHASLGRQVPVEIVAGFTDALTRPRSAHAPNVWTPLHSQGWQPERGQHVTATSPDGTARLQFHQSGPGDAHWWASARNEHSRTWDALFTATTPMHLVQAFAGALADPHPVMRPHGDLPPSTQIRTTTVQVLPSQLSAWQQARVNAARTATWTHRPWATARPGVTPAARPSASRAGTSR